MPLTPTLYSCLTLVSRFFSIFSAYYSQQHVEGRAAGHQRTRCGCAASHHLAPSALGMAMHAYS